MWAILFGGSKAAPHPCVSWNNLRLSGAGRILCHTPNRFKRGKLMAVVSGQRLGPYEILSAIGKGGMDI
jgi:hypothetical protein